MLKKYQIFITILICMALLIYGIILDNTNFYKVICNDSDKIKIAEAVNEDKAPIKIFKDIGIKDELYALLDNSKNKSIMVFYNKNPFDLRIEGGKYSVYFDNTVKDKYESAIDNIYASIKYEFSSLIRNIKNSILK